jgi:hypothetical protein
MKKILLKSDFLGRFFACEPPVRSQPCWITQLQLGETPKQRTKLSCTQTPDSQKWKGNRQEVFYITTCMVVCYPAVEN